MSKVLSLLMIVFFCVGQNLSPAVFAGLVQKSAYFNKKNSDKFVVVYKSDASFAKSITKLIGATSFTSASYAGTQNYSNVIFVGMGDDDIKAAKGKSATMLTFSNDVANISVVSVVFGLRENSNRPQIIVNLSTAKDEADFKSNFLKIAQRK